jgi:hypothetical protein
VTEWVYDIGTQAIAGLVSGAVVGTVLLYSQFRMERRLERERRVLDDQRELLGAAINMHQVVGRALAGTGSAERVGAGCNEAGRAGADWAAIEAVRDFSDEVLKASRAAREELNSDLLAIVARSPLGGGVEPSEADRARWLAIGKRGPLEVLGPLIAACKRMPLDSSR